jgi:hypothetical protein
MKKIFIIFGKYEIKQEKERSARLESVGSNHLPSPPLFVYEEFRVILTS